jgi:hypothetical protein
MVLVVMISISLVLYECQQVKGITRDKNGMETAQRSYSVNSLDESG